MSNRVTLATVALSAGAYFSIVSCSDRTSGLPLSAPFVGADSQALDSHFSYPGWTYSVGVTIDSTVLATGHTAHAAATVHDGFGNPSSNAGVQWSSSDASTASVTSDGAVRGVAAGHATITATYHGATGQVSLTIRSARSTAPVSTVRVHIDSASIAVGHASHATAMLDDAQGNTLIGRTVSWVSSNTSIATVSSGGVVTAVQTGDARIVAYSEGEWGYASLHVANGKKPTDPPATPPTSPTQPAPPSAPTQPVAPPPPSSSGSLASANFDDGTYGTNFLNETPGHDAIVADPTGAGRGKVLQITYAQSSGASSADLNQFISYNPTSGLSHGSTTYFRGDVYFPTNTASFANDNILRKLTYWRTDRPQNTQCDFVLFMFGNQLGVSVARPSHTTTAYNVFGFQTGQWYRVEIQATMNSKPGSADGITRVWINGNVVYEKVNETYTESGDPTTTRWHWLTVGHQREGASGESSINELRYWDNVAFSTARLGQ